jgi:hypothetical protein
MEWESTDFVFGNSQFSRFDFQTVGFFQYTLHYLRMHHLILHIDYLQQKYVHINSSISSLIKFIQLPVSAGSFSKLIIIPSSATL